MSEPQDWQRLAWAIGAHDAAVDEPPDDDPDTPSFREWAERVHGGRAREFLATMTAYHRIQADKDRAFFERFVAEHGLPETRTLSAARDLVAAVAEALNG